MNDHSKKEVALSKTENIVQPGRREFLIGATAVTAVLVTGTNVALGQDATAVHTLPPLPYGYDALAPIIDAQTMTIHHTKHHQTYVDKLNAALVGHADLASQPVESLLKKLDQIPEAIRTAIRNHGGGHANHSLFWKIMRPASQSGTPAGELASEIKSKFGSLENLQQALTVAATGQFGSGWAWLVKGDQGLEVVATANQDSPLSSGKTPLLGIDVWEHAYYLTYQNRRPDYVTAFWKLVNWDQVALNHAIA
jgi:superoxide dismutase, Fe-Mn family